MDGERHEDGDDQRLLPHAEDARTDDGQTGQDLEAHLKPLQRTERFLEHLDAADGDARDGQKRNEKPVIAQEFSHHHEQQYGLSDASTDESPLVWTEAV